MGWGSDVGMEKVFLFHLSCTQATYCKFKQRLKIIIIFFSVLLDLDCNFGGV